MEYKGYRLMNLYQDAEKDIIDDMKGEIKYLKQKVKEYNYRENKFENDMDIIQDENKRFKRELEKTRKELIDAKETLQEIEKMENEEIAELDMKNKFTSEQLAKKENIENEYLKVKAISENVLCEFVIVNISSHLGSELFPYLCGIQ